MIRTIDALNARALVEQGAALVDIREPAEFASERIPGAELQPLSRLAAGPATVRDSGTVIFTCRSGQRTAMNAARLVAAAPGCTVFLLEGGLNGWLRAGLPVERG